MVIFFCNRKEVLSLILTLMPNHSLLELFIEFIICLGNTITKCRLYYIINQSADSTAWTAFLMVFNYYSWYCVNANQLPTPTFYYMHECQDSLIQCSTTRVFVSIPTPWIYSSLLWTTEIVQHTSAQSMSTFSALILAGDKAPGWDSG
mgnify:CR=1 FL=1